MAYNYSQITTLLYFLSLYCVAMFCGAVVVVGERLSLMIKYLSNS